MPQPQPLQLGKLVPNPACASPGDYWEDGSGGYMVNAGKNGDLPILRQIILDHLDRKKTQETSAVTKMNPSPFAFHDKALDTGIFVNTFEKVREEALKQSPIAVLRKESLVLADFLTDMERKCRFGRRYLVSTEAWESMLIQTSPPVKKVRFSDLAKAAQFEVDPLADSEGIGKPVSQPKGRLSFLHPTVGAALDCLGLSVLPDLNRRGIEFRSQNPVNLFSVIRELQVKCVVEGLEPKRLYIGRWMMEELKASNDFMRQMASQVEGGTIIEDSEVMGMKVILVMDSDFLRVEGDVRQYSSAPTPPFSATGTVFSTSSPMTQRTTMKQARDIQEQQPKDFAKIWPDFVIAGSPPPATITSDASSVPAAETPSGVSAPEQRNQ